jgi:hypothetical protein
MAGVNRTSSDVIARLVGADGTAEDVLLPPHRAVLLVPHLQVTRVVLLDVRCAEIGTAVFGDPQDPFAAGGQVYVGPRNEAGVTTTQLVPNPALVASAVGVCAGVPTPADPRSRVPFAGGQAEP